MVSTLRAESLSVQSAIAELELSVKLIKNRSRSDAIVARERGLWGGGLLGRFWLRPGSVGLIHLIFRIS